MPQEESLATAPVLKLTYMHFFRELEERLNEITPEMLDKTPIAEISVTESETCFALGPMSESLKRLLCYYSQLTEVRNGLFYDFLQVAAGKSREVIDVEMNVIGIAENRLEFVRELFFTALRAEYPNVKTESIGFFGPNFEVYVIE